MPLSFLPILFAALFCLPALGDPDSTGWTFTIGCPPTGSEFSTATFTASTGGGFSGSGTCTRTSNRFTKFVFTSSSGGTLNSNTVFALHTGDILIFPPLLNTETQPVFTAATKCPQSTGVTMTWIFIQWSSDNWDLTTFPTLGTAWYPSGYSLWMTAQYKANGGIHWLSPEMIPGVCNTGTGVYTATGDGDRRGSFYMTMAGSGVYKTGIGHGIFLVPQQSLSPATVFGSKTFRAMMFDSESVGSTYAATATANAAGTVYTVTPYSNVETETINSDFTDTISISTVDHPATGTMTGTVTRTGTGAGSASMSCIFTQDINAKIICSGPAPFDSNVPYNITLVNEGMNVLGQPTPNSFLGLEKGMTSPNGIVITGTKLYIADTANHRILGWSTLPTASYRYPDFVLGQTNFISNASGTSSTTLSSPSGIATDGTKLYVADKGNHRVLIWNTLPTTIAKAADVVLGQPNMSGNTANNGGLSASTLSSPEGVYSDGTRLFVADTGNHRTLKWNAIPTVDQTAANVALGQPDATSNTANNGGIGAGTMSSPIGIYSDGTNVFVSDSGNHRVLGWTAMPTGHGETADFVLGQANMTSSSTGTTSTTLNSPQGVASNGTKLFVADKNNSRILIWNTLPSTDQVAADVAVGQANLSSGSAATTSTGLSSPIGVTVSGANFAIADTGNHRANQWTAIPTSDGDDANYTQGQSVFTTALSSYPGVTGQNFASESGSGPYQIGRNGTKFLAADASNNRILIWNTEPTNNYPTASLALGQSNLTSATVNSGGVSTGLSNPKGVSTDGTRVVVGDTANHRVLVWTSFPSSSGQSPNFVLGQSALGNNSANAGGSVSAQTMQSPQGVFTDGTNLFVADTANNRVLIWTSFPTTTQEAADIVIGQPDVDENTADNGGISASTMDGPTSVYFDGTVLYVADTGNHRVLVWDTLPAATGEAADRVLGQANFTGQTAGAVSATTMNAPYGIYSTGTRLFVTDTNYNRVLFWNTLPTNNGQAADGAIGQADLSSSTAGVTAHRLDTPLGVVGTGNRMFVADSGSNRVLVTIP